MKTIAPERRCEDEKSAIYSRYSGRALMLSRMRRSVRGLVRVFFNSVVSAGKRAVDISAALILFPLTSPIYAFALICLRNKSPKLKETPTIGMHGRVFARYSFDFDEDAGSISRFGGLPVLINILNGDMSFVGPRAIEATELDLRDRTARRRLDVRPGLFCLWWLRRRANIDYDTEFASDAEYVNSHSVRGDLGIAVRAIPAILYGGKPAGTEDRINILGLPIDNVSMSEAIDLIAGTLAARAEKPAQFCFVNADCANIAVNNPAYQRVLERAEFVFADGIGMKLAAALLKTGIKQNVNGTDLFPFLCEKLAGTGKKIFLLGARPGIPESVAEWVQGRYPQTTICGTHHGYFTDDERSAVIRQINESGADLLLVAFGAPRQDIWIAENLANLNVGAAIGVGGLFDYYSGRIPRAPQWLREMGLEWIFRFYQEPRRMWRRYFVGNFIFLVRVMLEKSGRRKYQLRKQI